MEKANEHCTKIFMLFVDLRIFVDLRKAYGSVPRQAQWHVLRIYGVPESMLRLICSLHDGMKAEVTVVSQATSR